MNNNDNLRRIYGRSNFPEDNNRLTDFNETVGEFREAQERIRTEFQRALPNVSAVSVVPAGSVRPINWKALSEEEDDNRVSNRYGEARGRKRPSACMDQDEQTTVHPRTDVLRLEQPPWKLPRCEERDKGKGVLREGGELYCVSPLRTDPDEDDVGDGYWYCGDGGDLGSPDHSQDGWGTELSRPSVAWSSDQSIFSSDDAAYRTDMRTACDGLRESIRMGQVPTPITLWSNEYGQDDASGEPITPSPVHAPFRPPRRLEGGSHGDHPGRYVVPSPPRRSADPPLRYRNGVVCPCPLPRCDFTEGSTEDSDDEQGAP